MPNYANKWRECKTQCVAKKECLYASMWMKNFNNRCIFYYVTREEAEANGGWIDAGEEYEPIFNFEPKRNDYVFVANGKCPSDDQTGGITDVDTIQQCRDECNDFHETYFSILDNGGAKLQCRCYKDCDTHEDAAKTKIYEILSVT